MRKQITLVVLGISLAAISSAHAQEPRNFSLLATHTIQLPGTTYSVVFNSPQLQAGERRNIPALTVAIASWLSANFDLPPMHLQPRIAYAPASEIAVFRSQGSPVVESVKAIPSLYDNHSQTIFLPEGWNGSTPAEMSAFVREMTHHLLNEAQYTYRCVPDADSFAHTVQLRWLAMVAFDEQPLSLDGSLKSSTRPRCVSLRTHPED